MRRGGGFLAVLALTCQPSPTAARQGEVLVVVDTDAPVPKLASRLRVDLYTTDGSWYETRDLSLSRPADWPASFGVALADGEAAKDVVVRLRAYPDGFVRDFRGEQFQDRPSVCDDATCATTAARDCCPLQLPATLPPVAVPVLGAASPPASEPEPLVAIDRLMLVHVEPGAAGTASVVLAGACFGTMADLRDFTRLATCVDTEAKRVAVTATQLSTDPSTVPTSSRAGTFEAAYAMPCSVTPRSASRAGDGTPLHDDEACVTGGAFVFGGRDWFPGDGTDSLPERTAVVPSFLMDRYEVTVGRYRAALADGLTGSRPYANDGPLEGSLESDSRYCTWSDTPVGREEYPVTCVDYPTARAFCQRAGGDLPSEVQREYAASMEGRTFKTHYPWGDATGSRGPSCDDVVYARGLTEGTACASRGVGPARVDATEHAGGDVTPPGADGATLVGLAGNVLEWATDVFADRHATCWMAASLVDPTCASTYAPAHAARGAFWSSTPISLTVGYREGDSDLSPFGGFRCARPGGP